MTLEAKNRSWVWVVPIVFILVFGILVVSACPFSLYDEFNPETIQAFIESFGSWAPVIYAFIYIISSPIPFLAAILSPLGGLLFGTLRGTLLVIGIATTSSLVPFMLARHLGREWVESKMEGKKFEEIYQQSESSRGFIFILLMRFVPILPWEVQSYLAGLTRVPASTYLLATALGIVPGTTSLVFLGDAIKDPTSWKFYTAIGLNVIMGGAPVIAMLIRKRRKLQGENAVR